MAVNYERQKVVLNYVFLSHLNIKDGSIDKFIEIIEDLKCQGYTNYRVYDDNTDFDIEFIEHRLENDEEYKKRIEKELKLEQKRLENQLKDKDKKEYQKDLEIYEYLKSKYNLSSVFLENIKNQIKSSN